MVSFVTAIVDADVDGAVDVVVPIALPNVKFALNPLLANMPSLSNTINRLLPEVLKTVLSRSESCPLSLAIDGEVLVLPSNNSTLSFIPYGTTCSSIRLRNMLFAIHYSLSLRRDQ